jgi:6-phosphogluconolactonase (cycloisomerase 2 family)
MQRLFVLLAFVPFVACSSDDDDSGGKPKTDSGTGGSTTDSGTGGSSTGGSSGGGTGGATTDSGTGGTTGPVGAYLYVSVGSESRLAVLRVDEAGMLEPHPELDLTLPQHPRAMTWDAPRRRIYIGFPDGSIGRADVDATGKPTYVDATAGQNVGEPVYVSISADGNRLISAYFGGDLLRVHDSSSDPPWPIAGSIDTENEPHAALVHGNLIYVPHRNGGVTRWYSLANDGQPQFEGELSAESGVGPRHIAFSANGQHAYIANEFDDSVSSHTVAGDGTLTRFETVSMLPSGADGSQNTAADIHVSPDGHVYASNRGHDSIAVFSADASGALTLVDNVDTEETPREFDLSASGQHLLVAGQGNGFLASYLVGTDGGLTQADRLEIADDLRWIVSVED